MDKKGVWINCTRAFLGLLFQSNAIRNQQVAAVCWLALSPHSKKVLTGFSPGLCGPSLGTPAASHSPGTWMLAGNSKVVVGENVSLNACVSLSDSHMTQLWLVQVYTASGLRSNNILKTNRQRKQSCTSQFVLMITLDPAVFCSSRKPHVGRAQM